MFADTADAGATGSSATYSTARGDTGATSNTATTQVILQGLTGGTYSVSQYFGRFDTSAVPAGASTGTLSVNVTVAPGAATDTWEVRETPSLAARIDGSTLGTYTLFGSLTQPIANGRAAVSFSDASTLSRSASLNLLISSQNERLNSAPVGVETNTINTANVTGTTNDPFLRVVLSPSWQFVAITGVTTVATNNITLSEPTGAQAGDLLVAVISYRSASGGSNFSAPAADIWSSVAQVRTDNTLTTSSAVASGAMFYGIRGAGSPSYAFTRSAGADVAMGRVVAYRNVAQTSPLDATNGGQTTPVNTTSVSVTGLTTLQDDDLIVAMFAGGQEASVTAFAATTDLITASTTASNVTTNPAPAWVERADSISVTGSDTSLSVFDAVKPVAGSIGNLICTAAPAASHVVIAGAFKIAPPAKTISAGVGAFNLTGTAATPTKGHPLAAGPGSYALTGTAASPIVARKIVPVSGSYSLAGTDATLTIARKIVAGSEAYSLTGEDAALRRGIPLTADAGAYEITGVEANLRRTLVLLGEADSYSIVGTSATTALNRIIAANDNSYSLVGDDVSLTHSVVLTLSADVGSYALTGDSASLLVSGDQPQPPVVETPPFVVSGGTWPFRPHHFPRPAHVQNAHVEGHYIAAVAGFDSGYPLGNISVSALAHTLTMGHGTQAGLTPGFVTAQRNLADDELLILLEAA